MTDKKDELNPNEEYLLDRDEIKIEVSVPYDEPVINVKFRGFNDQEDAEEYAQFLAEHLSLLLFETIKIH
jgi:hypothetical protein